MKSRNYTTIEQSKHLIELGLDTETSDMHYANPYKDIPDEYGLDIRLGKDESIFAYRTTPAWSTDALLELMPMHVSLDKGIIGNYKYICTTNRNDVPVQYWHRTSECEKSIDACYEMMVWFLENNLLDEE